MATRKVKVQSEGQRKASSTNKQVLNGNGINAKAARIDAPIAPTVEQIRQRAYLLYLERGATHGQDWNDWFVAEKQLVEGPTMSP